MTEPVPFSATASAAAPANAPAIAPATAPGAPTAGPSSWPVAVLMQRVANQGPAARWQPWRWQLADVVSLQDPAHAQAFSGGVRRLRQDPDGGELWLHPGLQVELHKDAADGYWLNATSGAPCWFVLWRLQTLEHASAGDEPMAVPIAVSLSYDDAGRWLDAQESVEQSPAPPDVVAWMCDFAEPLWQPQGRKRRRPESFRPLQDRFGQPARISTGDERPRGPGEAP
jgi:hypothetical protein